MNNLSFEHSSQGLEEARGAIAVDGNKIPFTLERPDRRQFGGEIADDVMVLVTGWTETENSLQPLRTATARLGMAAVTIHHPRYRRPDNVLRGAHLRVTNVAAVAELLADDYPTVNLAGHSMGGIDVVRATREHDLDINALFLLGSAGLIASDDFHHVAPRFLKAILQEESDDWMHHPISESRFIYESIKTIVSNPALAASEGVAAATHYVARHIAELTERGIIAVNVMADGDNVFPYKEVLASTADVPFDVSRIFANSRHNFTSQRPNEVAAFLTGIVGESDSIRAQRNQTVAITPEAI
jgi:pimeloyl-ACP methyl ester carboxylesterase